MLVDSSWSFAFSTWLSFSSSKKESEKLKTPWIDSFQFEEFQSLISPDWNYSFIIHDTQATAFGVKPWLASSACCALMILSDVLSNMSNILLSILSNIFPHWGWISLLRMTCSSFGLKVAKLLAGVVWYSSPKECFPGQNRSRTWKTCGCYCDISC